MTLNTSLQIGCKCYDAFEHYRDLLHGALIAPLKGGLPSRDPQILKSLILSVCLFVCPIFIRDLPNGICTGYKRRFHRVYFSRVPKPDPPFRRLTPGWTLQRGPIFFDIFSIFVHSKCACSDDLLNEIEIVISPAICWLLGSEAPLSGGQTAPRVQTSYLNRN